MVDEDLRGAGAFSVVVRGQGAEKIYRQGTVLIAVPLSARDGVLLHGQRVILQRIRDLVEVTVREVEVRNGHAWLQLRSSEPVDPAAASPVEMPWPSATAIWKRGEDRFLIAGVVIQALVPE